MNKSAKAIIRDVMLDNLAKSLSGMLRNNVDNAFIREAKAIHGNTGFNDLPDYLQRVINESTDQAFLKLHAQGFKVTSS